jgi:hypothetical protein
LKANALSSVRWSSSQRLPLRLALERIHLLVAFILLSFSFGVEAGTEFPPDGYSKSPNGKWRLVCKSFENREEETHQLSLEKRGGKSVVIRQFGRSCDVLWSPDSSRFSLTDWLGSNTSEVFIYSVTKPGSAKSICNLLPKGTIPDPELKGHCYFEAEKWIDNLRLRIRIFGHTDEVQHSHSFEHTYIFNVKQGHFE